MPRSARPHRVRLVPLCVAVVGGLAVGGAGPRRRRESPDPVIDAAAQRLQVADPVAAYKWKTHGAIEDPVRVRQELAKLGDDAVAARIDRDYITRVFGDQIGATEAIEYGRFADWKLNPGDAQPTPRTSRPRGRRSTASTRRCWRRYRPTGTCCTRRRARASSTPPGAPSSRVVGLTASTDAPSGQRRNRIASNNLIFPHHFLTVEFGLAITRFPQIEGISRTIFE